MSNHATEAEHLVTSCPDHGTVVAPDAATVSALAPAIEDCFFLAGDARHIQWHAAEGTSCWACCPSATNHTI